MAKYLQIHPVDPQARLISQVVASLRKSGVVIYPTDSCYAVGCQIGDKAAQDKIRQLRQLDDNHDFTLVCRDLSEISLYAKIDNSAYKLIKSLTPGPYTFILKATREVPRRLQNPKRKTIGLRIPNNPIALALLEELGEPIMSSTLQMPGDDLPMSDPDEINERLDKRVDMIINGGPCELEPTSVIELMDGVPVIRRRGRGDVSQFEEV
ncbi:MAG: L-threonylcarbamoyladenylate synthase [Gammaproteobacteria bacterium]